MSDIVLLKVGKGDDKLTFRVHKDLLLEKSPFFRASFNDNFVEGQAGSIDLPDDDVLSVKSFIHWLYYNEVDCMESWDVPYPYVKLYIFADKICTPKYHDRVIDAVRVYHKKTNTFMHPEVLDRLFVSGLNNTPIAKFGLQSITRSMMESSKRWLAGADFHKYFEYMENNVEVMKALNMEIIRYRTKPYDNPATLLGCYFHLPHDDDQDCTATKSQGSKSMASPGK